MAFGFVELVGYVTADFVFESFKTKPCTKLYLVSFTICLIGSIGLLINNKQSNIADLIFNYVAKFGIAFAF